MIQLILANIPGDETNLEKNPNKHTINRSGIHPGSVNCPKYPGSLFSEHAAKRRNLPDNYFVSVDHVSGIYPDDIAPRGNILQIK